MSYGALIVVIVVMTMPAMAAVIVVPPAVVAIAISISISVAVAVVDGRWRVDGGRRRCVDDGRRRFDIDGSRHAERHADIDVSECRGGRACAEKSGRADECQVFQRVAPFRASADGRHSMASDAHCRNAVVLMLLPPCCVCNAR